MEKPSQLHLHKRNSLPYGRLFRLCDIVTEKHRGTGYTKAIKINNSQLQGGILNEIKR